MTYQIIEAPQGSEQWIEIRGQYPCASEAPVMMNESRHMTRGELLRMKATGAVKEFSDYVKKRVLAKGHASEAADRVITVGELGEELYPVTAVSENPAYPFPMLASLDGITMDDATLYEHKEWNEELAAAVRAKDLSGHYYWQLEQQLAVTGAEKVLFVCSDGTREKREWMYYTPVPGRRGQLIAGWQQFEEDRKNYKHVEVPVVPTAAPIEALPALLVNIEGKVLGSNLAAFELKAAEFIAKIPTQLTTDQHFADAGEMVKFLKDGEERLELVKEQALAQTASIDTLFRTIDKISDQMRTKRLALNTLVTTRKEAIRGEILTEHRNAFETHIAELNKVLGRPYMPLVAVDFAGVMKGKRTVTSLRDACGGELARAKIEANRIANGIQVNLTHLREHAKDHAFLFSDTAAIVLKAADDLATLVKSRIADHKAAEEKKEADTREKIRAEETAKLQREQQQRQDEEDALVASFERNSRRIEHDSVPYIQKATNAYESVAKDWESDPRPRVREAFLAGRAYLKERMEFAQARQEAEAAKAAQPPAPAPVAAPAVVVQAPAANSPNVVPIQRQAAPTSVPTLTLGQINERIGLAKWSEADLTAIGFPPAATRQNTKLYHEAEFGRMLDSAVAHLRMVAAQREAA